MQPRLAGTFEQCKVVVAVGPKLRQHPPPVQPAPAVGLEAIQQHARREVDVLILCVSLQLVQLDGHFAQRVGQRDDGREIPVRDGG